jgi:hypothetical protein
MAASNWIALMALVVAAIALLFTRWQAIGTMRQAVSVRDAYNLSRATAYADIIMKFVGQFLDLTERGDPKTAFKSSPENDRWIYNFWALYTIEFWYFHHRLLPADMYTYWMGVLAEFYASDPIVYRSHKLFLASYEHTYPQMAGFFQELYNIAENNSNPAERNRRVKEHVDQWLKAHYADIELDEDGRIVPPR